MRTTHRVIPIFLPEMACPHRCVYCNQFAIAGQIHVPAPEEITTIIEKHLSTMPVDAEKRIAFFGGSFTEMPIVEQTAYLRMAQPYLQKGVISGIQLSTRPDYITPKILENLRHHGVTLIELGAQSLDNEILRRAGRGHTVRHVEEAAQLILNYGFQLGLQMMIGLPGDSKATALHTAQLIHEYGATYTRIYPTLVVQNTVLAKMYMKGLYQPLSIEQAVDWTKDLYCFFTKHNINILRIGLHPSEGLLSGKDYLAGPFHVSFKELVLTALWHDKIEQIVKENRTDKVTITIPNNEINYAVGYNSANKKAFPNVRFVIE